MRLRSVRMKVGGAPIRVLTAEPLGKRIVELLEQVLADARAGNLSSVAIATVDRDGCAGALFSFAPSSALQIGATSLLLHRLNQRMMDQ